MAVSALGYLGVRSDRLDDWSDFASRLLGMQSIDRGGKARAFRMDDRAQRLLVSDEPGEALASIGWEVAARDDLQTIAARLDRAGIHVTQGSRSLADRRFVEELIHFADPAGNRIELFWSPMLATEPFAPGRPIDGFNTGPLGMGHAVLHVRDIGTLLPFYRDLLGFRVTDYGLTPYPLYFFHVNGRHHSFAMVGSGRAGFHRHCHVIPGGKPTVRLRCSNVADLVRPPPVPARDHPARDLALSPVHTELPGRRGTAGRTRRRCVL